MHWVHVDDGNLIELFIVFYVTNMIQKIKSIDALVGMIVRLDKVKYCAINENTLQMDLFT